MSSPAPIQPSADDVEEIVALFRLRLAEGLAAVGDPEAHARLWVDIRMCERRIAFHKIQLTQRQSKDRNPRRRS